MAQYYQQASLEQMLRQGQQPAAQPVAAPAQQVAGPVFGPVKTVAAATTPTSAAPLAGQPNAMPMPQGSEHCRIVSFRIAIDGTF